MPSAARDRFMLRDVLERGPLGALSTPETGFVWDAALAVWEQLDMRDRMRLYMASWPFVKKGRWRVLYEYHQGKRTEYGLYSSYGFGTHTRRTLLLVGLGHVVHTNEWCTRDDYDRLGKLFALLKRHGGLKLGEIHGSKSLERWRGELVRLL